MTKFIYSILSLAVVMCVVCIIGLGFAISSMLMQHRTQYVIGGSGSNDGSVLYLVLAPCSERPSSWDTAQAVCNLDDLTAVRVDAATYQQYDQGEAYP